MASLDIKDFNVIVELERDFARTLRSTLLSVFDVSADIGNIYIESLLSAPMFERLIALHESPIDVASTLTGTLVSDEMLVRYDLVLMQQDALRILSPRDEHLLTPFRPVSEATVEAILKSFGYEKVNAHGESYVLWQLFAPDEADPDMQTRVIIPFPPLVLDDGRRCYNYYFVLALISYLTFGKISTEGAMLILKALTR